MRRIEGQSHIELPCNEITGEQGSTLAAQAAAAARRFWSDMVSSPHSFTKPVFQLGLGDWSVTNIMPDGAFERTPGRVERLPNGAAGFSRVGDSICFAINVRLRPVRFIECCLLHTD